VSGNSDAPPPNDLSRDADVRGFVSRIRRNAVHDGPGIRTIVFLQGCPLRCLWCAAPETQALRSEVLLYPERCLACGQCRDVCRAGAIGPDQPGAAWDRSRCAVCGACAAVCPAEARILSGAEMTVAEVVAEASRDRVFYRHSGGGVTVSGGEPLLQPAFTAALLRTCKEATLHTAMETSGYAAWEVLAPLLSPLDLLLYDIKAMDPSRHQQLTGVSNALILSNLENAARRVKTIVRVPVISGLNDDLENCRELARFLKQSAVQSVDLLPYHRLGEATYGRLDREYALTGGPLVSEDRLADLVSELRKHGLSVCVGG